MRITVVEDNKILADGIARAFRAEGHSVGELYDGAGAVQFLAREPMDLIILDINLPGESGLKVLSSLRRKGVETPVLILTAQDGLEDKIDGLDLGADDYMTKPFDLAELLARGRALLRRADKSFAAVLSCGGIALDLSARELRLDGRRIDLPRRELALAEALLTRAGHVISKEQIIAHLYGVGADIEEGTVELYIHRLRKRLGARGDYIKTVRGLGYCFRQPS